MKPDKTRHARNARTWHRSSTSRPASRARRLLLALLIGTALSLAVTPAASHTQGAALRLGSVQLTPCTDHHAYWCAQVPLPLDRTDPHSPAIAIGFEWIPALGPATGTTVAVEGGPGWASTRSHSAYLAMLGPLRAGHNLLLFDLRGTGSSQALNCPGLQSYPHHSSGPDFAQAVAACGEKLNHTWQHPDGTWIHASDLFATANATRDLADTLHLLNLPRIDLYGDSYGTWFAQAYASRYPATLRSLTLDASYEVLGLNPWYPDTASTAHTAFDLACQRAPACTRQALAPAWATISQLATRLRAFTLTGPTTDLKGGTVNETVDLTTLVDLVNNAGSDPAIYQSLQAAAQALLTADDPAPLLRLAYQSTTYDGTTPLPPDYSDALYFAVACTDYPQLFSMTASPAQRARQLQQNTVEEPSAPFAPFTPAEWITVNAYTNAYDACLDWPAPIRTDPPITATPPLVPATVPVLVLGGDLDSLTPLAGGEQVARQLGPSARLIAVPNLTHITAMPNTAWPGPEACGQNLYRQFVDAPGRLGTLDTSCTTQTPPIPALGAFPQHLADALPATPSSGNFADGRALRAASVGASTVGDAIARNGYLDKKRDRGLRGGSWTSTSGTPTTFTFHDVRWVEDATVNGTARWDPTSGDVSAHLKVHCDGVRDTKVEVTWNTTTTQVPAVVTGTTGHTPLRATVPAP
ncbi:pimeloyl-ACP methyl ester carboxylesterase [Kitasatospora sp. GAS204A]|nr:pimeloyl-ACP methyl ester carboxylesterase [Kitasatospora sp. GAS204B]